MRSFFFTTAVLLLLLSPGAQAAPAKSEIYRSIGESAGLHPRNVYEAIAKGEKKDAAALIGYATRAGFGPVEKAEKARHADLEKRCREIDPGRVEQCMAGTDRREKDIAKLKEMAALPSSAANLPRKLYAASVVYQYNVMETVLEPRLSKVRGGCKAPGPGAKTPKCMKEIQKITRAAETLSNLSILAASKAGLAPMPEAEAARITQTLEQRLARK